MSEKIPKEWKWVKLGEVADVRDGTHDSPKEAIDGKYLITSKHIKNGKIDFSKAYKISLDDFEAINKRSKVDKYDILFSMIGTIGEMVIVDFEPDFAIKNVGLFKTGNKDLSRWIYYYLKSNDAQAEIYASLKGSTQQYITLGDLRNFPILLPPLPEQKAIVEVLSSIDDKIDLLHRQNKTLEEMAMTLFRQWFMGDNISNDIIELGSLVDIISGISYKSTDLNPSTTAMVSLKCFDRNGEFRIDGFKEFTGNYKEQHIVKEGDLIVAHTDITQDAEVIGNPAIVISNPKYTKMVISMDIVKVIPKVNWISIEFLYFLMRTREFKGHCEGSANGSTVLHLSKQAIPTFEFKTPKREMVIEFTKQAKELLNKTFLNQRQILTLIHLRDTLLPKLMSGEVRVKF
jgi:type I restriction enzyme S subunit